MISIGPPVLRAVIRRVLAIWGLWLGAIATSGAAPAAPIDCPLRDRPFSIDAPLIDVLLSPAARAVLDRQMPGLVAKLPPRLFSADPPSFAAIVSMRALLSFQPSSTVSLADLDTALRAVPVTAADKVARCARYDEQPIATTSHSTRPRLLVFQKINGYRDGPSVDAAETALRAIAARRGWDVVVSDQGGAMTSATLAGFDAVVWNNVSGDVLTLRQRAVFRRYIEQGGGFVGLHGSGGDPTYFWDWYADALIGARFKGHPMNPQFQDAYVAVDDRRDAIVRGLPARWTMNDEWYSFVTNPRATGAHVLLTLDETSYSPREGDRSIAMGDHPIAWTRCVGNGRAFYSAIGHRPAIYAEPRYVRLLERAIDWAGGRGATRCAEGREIAAR